MLRSIIVFMVIVVSKLPAKVIPILAALECDDIDVLALRSDEVLVEHASAASHPLFASDAHEPVGLQQGLPCCRSTAAAAQDGTASAGTTGAEERTLTGASSHVSGREVPLPASNLQVTFSTFGRFAVCGLHVRNKNSVFTYKYNYVYLYLNFHK